MARSSVQMTVSLPPDLYRRAMAVAKVEFRSKSELVREALRMYVGRKQRVDHARKQLSESLRHKGINTLEDIERYADEAGGRRRTRSGRSSTSRSDRSQERAS